MFSRLIVFSIALVAGASLPPTGTALRTQAPVGPNETKKIKTSSCAAKPDTLQEMFVPLAHLRYFDFGELVLNNNGIDPLTVQPIWFVTGSTPVPGRPVEIAPLTMKFTEISDLLPDRIPPARIDGVRLEYSGKLLELGGQVVLRHHGADERGDSLDVHFSMTMDFKTLRREATWTAARGESAVLVLANTGDAPIDVQIASSYRTSNVKVGAYQSRLVRLQEPAIQFGEHERRAMWAAVESTGAPGDLRVTGFVTSEHGAPRLIRFYDPGGVKQSYLYATRMRVKNAMGDMALKNTSVEPVSAWAQFLDTDSGQVLLELGPVTLEPNAAQTIDLRAAMASLSASVQTGAVSVRVESNGPPGSLIGSLYTYDTKTATQFDVPLRDSGAARSSTGSYPWRIDDDYETRVSITNAGSTVAQFVARIAYDSGGELVFKARELAPGASATFDLRLLRDQGTKDGKGNALPRGAKQGRFIWTVINSGQSARLVGRAEVTSVRLGVSSSYSCGQCCPDSWLFSTISPYEQSMLMGNSASYTIVGYWENCYHSQWSMTIAPYGWNVYTPDVASLATESSGGRATGEWEGATDFGGWWGVETWEPYVEDCIVDSSTWEQPGRALVSCAQPVNFHQITGQPQGSTGLFFQYDWDSSTGNLAHLAHCQVGERVHYSPWPVPIPPWSDNPIQDFVANVPASDGGFDDPHSTGFPITPFSQSTTIGSQIYRHNCRCAIGAPEWTTLHTPFGGIVRSIDSNGNGTWRFTITKSGVQNGVNPLPQ